MLALLIVASGCPGETVEACISRMKTADHHLEGKDVMEVLEPSGVLYADKNTFQGVTGDLIHEMITEHS